jgi:protein-S-isoprenylcysteine O-methyltransferase Ste14
VTLKRFLNNSKIQVSPINLELKIPPAIVFLVACVACYYTPDILPYSFILGDSTIMVSRMLFALAIVIGVMGLLTFKKASTTVDPVNINKASNLVTEGIFQFTRNPMYVAMALGIISIGMRFDSALNLVWLLVYVMFITRFQIMPEERALLKIFGEPYAEYLQKVRRWI